MPSVLAMTKAWLQYCDSEHPLDAIIKHLASVNGVNH
jgi:hypothetical protein